MTVALENRVIIEFEINKRKVQEVNSLLRKAFGRPIPILYGIQGNLGFSPPEAMDLYTFDHLEEIGTTNLMGATRIGKFTEKDGSSIRLSGDRYLNEVRRYAELYKAKYGKDVHIEVA